MVKIDASEEWCKGKQRWAFYGHSREIRRDKLQVLHFLIIHLVQNGIFLILHQKLIYLTTVRVMYKFSFAFRNIILLLSWSVPIYMCHCLWLECWHVLINMCRTRKQNLLHVLSTRSFILKTKMERLCSLKHHSKINYESCQSHWYPKTQHFLDFLQYL